MKGKGHWTNLTSVLFGGKLGIPGLGSKGHCAVREYNAVASYHVLQETDREGLWVDGDSGSDTEGVEDRRALWHSDVIKYSKTGTT